MDYMVKQSLDFYLRSFLQVERLNSRPAASILKGKTILHRDYDCSYLFMFSQKRENIELKWFS